MQALINAAEGSQQFKGSTQEEKHCVSEEKKCNYLLETKLWTRDTISVPTNHCKADSVCLTESTALLITLWLLPSQDTLVPSLLARGNSGQVEGSSWEKWHDDLQKLLFLISLAPHIHGYHFHCLKNTWFVGFLNRNPELNNFLQWATQNKTNLTRHLRQEYLIMQYT